MAIKRNNLNQYLTFKNLISRVFFGLKNIPYKFMLILILLSLWLGEWYPISNVPMYSTFSNSTNFIYITDGRDKPIPLKLEFGFHPAFLKKVYNSRVKKLSDKNNKQNINKDLKESLKELLANNNISQNTINKILNNLSEEIYQEEIYVKAGEQLLQYIVKERNPKGTDYNNYQQLKLWNVIITLKNNRIVQKQKLIAKLQLS